MDKRIIRLVVFFSTCIFCYSQDSNHLQENLQYRENFSSASLSEKISILKEAASDENADEYAGLLYEDAFQFAIQYFELLGSDPEMTELIRLAVKGTSDLNYTESLHTLWELFLVYREKSAAIEILLTIGKLGEGDAQTSENINNFLIEHSNLFSSGIDVDYILVSACIAAINEIGDSSSFAALFSVICAEFPEVVVFEAAGAMDHISGNLLEFFLQVIGENPPREKYIAFNTGDSSVRLSQPERGILAEFALEHSLAFNEENVDISAMRYAAVLTLTELNWTRAGPLAVRHYYRVNLDFQNGIVSKERLCEAINLLGAAGDSSAAMVLALHLGLINVHTEETGLYDAEITIAIIRALGNIGDKAAFNNLYRISYLRYNDNIKAAAREALNRLEW